MKNSQSTASPSPQQSSLESNTTEPGSEFAQKSRDQSTGPHGTCQQPIWCLEKQVKLQQTETHMQAKAASLGSGANPSSQLDLEMEKRFLLESFAPHSCVSPTTCRQHPEYNSENADPVPLQWCRITPRCFEPIVGLGHSHQSNPDSNAGKPNCHESTKPPVSRPVSAREPCRQTIWRRKKREEAKMERLRKRPVLQAKDPNPVQQQSGPDADLMAEDLTLAVEKWPRGPVVRNVGLKNKVLDAGTYQALQ